MNKMSTYVDWMLKRPSDMLNTGVLIMSLDQAVAWWKMDWTVEEGEEPAFNLFATPVVFVRDLMVKDKAFKGRRMDATTAAEQAKTFGGKVVLSQELGLMSVWAVDVVNNEITAVRIKVKTRLAKETRHFELELERLAAGWMPYAKTTMDVALTSEGEYKIVDFDELT